MTTTEIFVWGLLAITVGFLFTNWKRKRRHRKDIKARRRPTVIVYGDSERIGNFFARNLLKKFKLNFYYNLHGEVWNGSIETISPWGMLVYTNIKPDKYELGDANLEIYSFENACKTFFDDEGWQ